MFGVRGFAILLFALLAIGQGVVRCADFVVSAIMTGASENPPNNSQATGTATLTYNSVLDQLSAKIVYSGLTAPATAAQIHLGRVGISGPVIFPVSGVPLAGSASFTIVFTSANLLPSPADGIHTFADAVSAIQSGKTYCSIDDANFPSGEIRGQLAATASVPMPTAGWGGIGLFVAVVVRTLVRRWRAA